MRPGKSKIAAFITLAIAVALASLGILHRAKAKIGEDGRLQAWQAKQIAMLAAEGERLSNNLTSARSSRRDMPARELERLRLEADKLSEQTNELGGRLARSQGARKLLGCPSTPPGYEYTPEELALREEMTAGKRQDATSLSQAIYDYYGKHQGQFPASLDQLAPYLEREHLSLTGTNEFELIYSGMGGGLTNFPTQMLAVIRERQTWQAPNGRQARVYGMLTVPPRIVETEDNFQSWETEHIIPPPADNQ